MGKSIYLNVYDITCLNTIFGCLGLGVYHTGLEVGGIEYRFGAHKHYDTGVCTNKPKDGMGIYNFHKSIYLGECSLSE